MYCGILKLYVHLRDICFAGIAMGYVYEEPLLYDTFPDDFVWGAATAAYQVILGKAVSQPTNRLIETVERERESVAALVFLGIHSRISLSTITF